MAACLLLAAPRPAPAVESDAYVWVEGWGAATDSVRVCFPTEVPDAKARQLMAAIARFGGWEVTDVRVSTSEFISIYEQSQAETERRRPRGPKQTMVSCLLRGAVNYRTGWLRVEPFARALAAFPRLHLVFVVAPTFPFRGPGSFTNSSLSVIEEGHIIVEAPPQEPGQPAAPPPSPDQAKQAVYSYDITLAGPELPAGAFPAEPTTTARPRSQQVAGSSPSNLWLILAVTTLVAIAVGLITYALLLGRTRPPQPAPAPEESDPK